MSSIQHKRAWHARKQERMIFSEELEQFIEPVFALSTDVGFGTDSKARFINLCKKVKESMFEELMKNMMTKV